MNCFLSAAGVIPALAALVLVCSPASAQINSANVTLARSISGDVAAGNAISVTVSLTAAPPQGTVILALGLNETLPENATFGAITSTSGGQPSVKPANGDTGVLGFAWIDIPAFPYTMTYTVQLDGDIVLPTQISGQVEYRTTGGAEFSNVATTTVEEGDDGPAWKTGLFAGCAPGGADAASAMSDWIVVGMVFALLAVASRMQPRMRTQRLREDSRR